MANTATATFSENGSGVLGETEARIHLETREDNHRAAHALIRQGRRTIDVFSHDLESYIYNQPDILVAFTHLTLGHASARIRFLVRDVQPAVKNGHRLIELSRRISSYIEIRKVHTEYESFTQAFLLIDDYGVLHRVAADRFEGTLCFKDPLEVKRLRGFFEEVWEHSQPDPNIRRLHI